MPSLKRSGGGHFATEQTAVRHSGEIGLAAIVFLAYARYEREAMTLAMRKQPSVCMHIKVTMSVLKKKGKEFNVRLVVCVIPLHPSGFEPNNELCFFFFFSALTSSMIHDGIPRLSQNKENNTSLV